MLHCTCLEHPRNISRIYQCAKWAWCLATQLWKQSECFGFRCAIKWLAAQFVYMNGSLSYYNIFPLVSRVTSVSLALPTDKQMKIEEKNEAKALIKANGQLFAAMDDLSQLNSFWRPFWSSSKNKRRCAHLHHHCSTTPPFLLKICSVDLLPALSSW